MFSVRVGRCCTQFTDNYTDNSQVPWRTITAFWYHPDVNSAQAESMWHRIALLLAGSMWHRIASLLVGFCGLAIFFIVMLPSTESFFERIFPSRLSTFVRSFLQALSLSIILFGILGFFAPTGVISIVQHPISFIGVVGIATALFLWGNIALRKSDSPI